MSFVRMRAWLGDYSTSRRRDCRRRGRLSAALALIYFCAFAALGLAHTHAPTGPETERHPIGGSSAFERSGSRVLPVSDRGASAPCSLCAAASAAAICLAQPPTATHALAE